MKGNQKVIDAFNTLLANELAQQLTSILFIRACTMTGD